MMNRFRIEFCVRSNYSQDDFNSIEEVVLSAKNKNIKTLCLADDYTINGFEEFERCCKSNNIFPLFGTTINVCDGKIPSRVVLVAKNDLGIKELKTLLTLNKMQYLMKDIITICPNTFSIYLLDNVMDNIEKGISNFDYIGITPEVSIQSFIGLKKYDLSKFIALSDSFYSDESKRENFEEQHGVKLRYYRGIRSSEQFHFFPQEYYEQFVFDNPEKVIRENIKEKHIDSEILNKLLQILNENGEISVSYIQGNMSVGFVTANSCINYLIKNNYISKESGKNGKYRKY